MKIFLAGDYYSETGPSNATKTLLQALPQDTLYQKMHNKFLRIPEIIWKTFLSDVIIYSGASFQAVLGITVARLLRKPTFYIMHGSIAYESSINHDLNKKLLSIENFILKHIDYILAVSIPFENWLKERYPEYTPKIYHLINAIDWNLIKAPAIILPRNGNQIMSVGGGMPRKNILSLCKAIEILYQRDPDCKIRLIVAGAGGIDLPAIKAYSFVDYIGLVSHEEVLSYMKQSALYIQNSVFETFGLAPFEALLCGCNLLLSCHTGAISILSGINDNDIIHDPYDINEISNKIEILLRDNNHDCLLSSINFETSSPQYRAQELLDLIYTLIS